MLKWLCIYLVIYKWDSDIKTIVLSESLNEKERYDIIYNNENCTTTLNSVNRYISLSKDRYSKEYSKAYLFLKLQGVDNLFTKPNLVRMISEKCNIDIVELMIYNLMTEFAAGALCTSIIFKDKKNEIYLLSNLDWFFKDILIISKFKLVILYDNGSTKYEALSFFGMTGFSRIQTDKWSLALNSQFTGNTIYDKILNNSILEMLLESAEKNLNFEETILLLKNTNNYAGGFYSIISKDKGCILTKYPTNKSNLECINKDVNFLVQTNMDRNSDRKDRKKEFANSKLNNINNYQEIFEILTEKPLFVKYSTNFTTISKISLDFKYQIYIWEKNILKQNYALYN